MNPAGRDTNSRRVTGNAGSFRVFTAQLGIRHQQAKMATNARPDATLPGLDRILGYYAVALWRDRQRPVRNAPF